MIPAALRLLPVEVEAERLRLLITGPLAGGEVAVREEDAYFAARLVRVAHDTLERSIPSEPPEPEEDPYV